MESSRSSVSHVATSVDWALSLRPKTCACFSAHVGEGGGGGFLAGLRIFSPFKGEARSRGEIRLGKDMLIDGLALGEDMVIHGLAVTPPLSTRQTK
jgi:hypothetical protein